MLNFRVVLRRLHDADIESESAEMYPRGVCKTCAEKYKFDRREGSLYARVSHQIFQPNAAAQGGPYPRIVGWG